MEIKIMSLEELKKFIDELVKKEREDNKLIEAKYDKVIHAVFELVKAISDDSAFAKDATAFEDCLHKRSLREKRNFFINIVDECDGIVDTIMELTDEYRICYLGSKKEGSEDKK